MYRSYIIRNLNDIYAPIFLFMFAPIVMLWHKLCRILSSLNKLLEKFNIFAFASLKFFYIFGLSVCNIFYEVVEVLYFRILGKMLHEDVFRMITKIYSSEFRIFRCEHLKSVKCVVERIFFIKPHFGFHSHIS